MATKTISITKGAYDRLKILKKERESFTDVINRITKKKDLMDFYGIWSESTASKIENAILDSRKQNRKLSKERLERLERQWKE